MVEKLRIIRQPAAEAARQLFMLCADAGQEATALEPMATRLAEAFPAAAIVIVSGPLPMAEGGRWLMVPSPEYPGLERFDEADLAAAVEQALPGFIRCVRHCQAQWQVPPTATALLGVGEGATMALAAALSPGEPRICARVTAVGGRFAPLPELVPEDVLVHLLHGKQNQAVHFRHTVHTAEQLVRLKADITADVVPHEGSALSGELQDWVLQRLQTQVPRHLWEAAMRQAED